MPYSRLFYHFIWTTKRRLPLINESNREIIYGAIAAKVEQVNGIVQALNGVEDHIHLIVTVPPTLALSKFIGQIKAVSSLAVTRATGEEFAWQEEYGVLSVSESQLVAAINYVKCQLEHHRDKTLEPNFEP